MVLKWAVSKYMQVIWKKKQNNWAQISNPVVKHMTETWYNVGKYLKEIESI